MKKILLGVTMLFTTLAFAQNNYPDYYPSNDNDNYYTDQDDNYYFPDDYYYDYPSDYYSDDFYRNSYNDYRRSIVSVNWNGFFIEYNLSPWQIQQIAYLNNLYSSFVVWNNYYRHNPDRWYYDRFYALERILGPDIFVVYQNRYYHGYNPIAYCRNYRINHYKPIVWVQPRYRGININIYKVNRYDYHQNNAWNNPRQNIGFKDSGVRENGSWNGTRNNGFRDTPTRSLENSTSGNGRTNNNGFRNSQSNSIRNEAFRNQNSEMRNGNSNSFKRSSGNSEMSQQRQSSQVIKNSSVGRFASRR